MKIFVGSSSEAANSGKLDLICEWIEDKGHTPIPWKTVGLFPPGTYPLQQLQKIASEVGGAIFIFSEDDILWYRGSPKIAPRDNIILEYGLFVGRLDSLRVIIVRDGDPKQSSDIEGITYINLKKEARAKRDLSEWLETIEKSIKIPGTKTIIYHTNKYAMHDSNGYWHNLRRSAKNKLIIVGDTNKSWIGRDPEETHDFAQQIIEMCLSNKNSKVALVSREDALSSTMYFLRQYVLEHINDLPLEDRQFFRKNFTKQFTYSICQSITYKSVLSDDKLVILPNIVTESFREESLVLELNESNSPTEFNYYVQDIRRIVDTYRRSDLLKEIVDEIDS